MYYCLKSLTRNNCIRGKEFLLTPQHSSWYTNTDFSDQKLICLMDGKNIQGHHCPCSILKMEKKKMISCSHLPSHCLIPTNGLNPDENKMDTGSICIYLLAASVSQFYQFHSEMPLFLRNLKSCLNCALLPECGDVIFRVCHFM